MRLIGGCAALPRRGDSALIWCQVRNVFFLCWPSPPNPLYKHAHLAQVTALPVSLLIHPTMTEYDYSPEAYERYMATQTRISNWIDTVSQSMQTPSPSSRQSYDHHHPHQHQYQRHSRPTYPQQQQQHYPQQYPQQHTHSNTHSQTHSRSNSLTRSRSRTHHQQHYQEPPRPRSYSQTGSRPQAVHSHTAPIPPPPPPPHSRTYSYAMNQPPLPAPIPVPQPISYPHLAPRRSRTLPPQSQNVIYHTYEAPRGGPTYVIVPPVNGGGPHGHHLRVQSPVSILFLPYIFFPLFLPNKHSGSRG